MSEAEAIGRVLGSEHTSTQEFRVVLEEDEYAQLDDLVMTRTLVPKVGEMRTYGVVSEVQAVYEGASYESDTHRIAAEGILPGAKVRSATVTVTRVDPELWVAPDPGGVVERARGEERRRALYVDEMGRPLPAGLGRDGEPVPLDLDFFDGRKGGHMSISGVSGVATKTSFALFFLRMLTARPDIVGEGAANLRVLVFNVKGEDLLWLDKPNRFFDEEAAAGGGRRWASRPRRSSRCGSGPRRARGPATSSSPTPGDGRRASRCSPGRRASSSTRACCSSCSPTRRTRATRSRSSASACRRSSAGSRWTSPGRPGAVILRDPPHGGHERGLILGAPEPGETVVTDLRSLVDALEPFLEPEDGGEPDTAWTARVQPGTVSAFMRRMHAAAHRLGPLVRAGESRRIDRSRASVTVVAIQSLHELAQRFVVGALLNEAFQEKEQTGQRLPLSVVVLDELNKYAPARRAEPAEGHADRHRAARPVARRPAGRRAADGVEGRVRGHGERRHPGQRPAGRRGGRARRVRLDAPVDARPRPAAEAGHDGALAAIHPRAARGDVPLPAVGHAEGGGGGRG